MYSDTTINNLRHVESVTPFTFWWLWVIVGVGLTIYGFYIYTSKIVPLRKKEVSDKGFKRNLEYYIAYVPSQESKASHHIVAGACLSLGICIIFGIVVATVIMWIDNPGIHYHHIIFEAGGFAFAVLISLISFWTLWQTKKIEHLQGFDVSDLTALLKHLNKEILRIASDYDAKHHKKAQDYHRFLLVTTNPFLGLLSYPDDEDTNGFLGSLNRLKMIKIAENADKDDKNNSKKFRFEILCADETRMEEFHKEFFLKKEGSVVTEELKEKINHNTALTEDYLKQFMTPETPDIVHRRKEIPKFPQFAIVGNMVFEFTLEARAPFTEVTETHIVMDRKRCDMYEETFKLLKMTLPKQAQTDSLSS